MVGVDDVSRARSIHIAPPVLLQSIENAVVDTAPTDGGTVFVRLGGVIQHHVDDHLDPGRVQLSHHFLEFERLLAAAARALL